MKTYSLYEFQSKETYNSFIEYMLSHSEYFSFVYFGYGTNPKMKSGMREISDALKKYKVYSQKTLNMPGMLTLDTDNTYKLVIYRSDPEAYKVLTREERIFEWDYPRRPMDLAFFRDGYAWFTAVSHENDAFLITDDNKAVEDLKALGANVEPFDDYDEEFIFRWTPGEKISLPDRYSKQKNEPCKKSDFDSLIIGKSKIWDADYAISACVPSDTFEPNSMIRKYPLVNGGYACLRFRLDTQTLEEIKFCK